MQENAVHKWLVMILMTFALAGCKAPGPKFLIHSRAKLQPLLGGHRNLALKKK